MTGSSRILIVDDEPFNVDYLQQELEDLGYATVIARNGLEALEMVAAEPPDLILLDVMMPVMDGLAACRALKGADATRLIPVVIMTALDGLEDRIRGIEAGADDFLTKPVNQRELVARIQTALKLKHAVDRKLGELSRIKDHFAKFVPEAVKRLVLANPEAPELAKRERDVSVLFLDITGYAGMSERLAPDALNALVERYFSTFLDASTRVAATSTRPPAMGSWRSFKIPRPALTRAAPSIPASRSSPPRKALIAKGLRGRCRFTSGSIPAWRSWDRRASRGFAARAGRSPRVATSRTWRRG